MAELCAAKGNQLHFDDVAVMEKVLIVADFALWWPIVSLPDKDSKSIATNSLTAGFSNTTPVS